MCVIPVPGPVAPPQWYGPLLPDPESFISMVFTAFWMQNRILPILPTGTKEYSYITSLLPILPTGPTHLPHPQGGGGNHDHRGGDYIHPTPIHRGEGGNHDYLYYLQDHIHRGEGGNHDRGGRLPIGPTQLPHPQGGGGNHDHGGVRKGVSPNLEHIYPV